MRTFRLVTPLMLLVALVAPAFGQSAPEGFRNLKRAATQKEVSRAFPKARCEIRSSEAADWECFIYAEKVNDVDVDIVISGYNTGRAVGMNHFSLFFRSDDVERIVEAFESRYGRWTSVEEKKFLTKGGGRFPNTEWNWVFPNVMLSIQQHSGKLGDGQAQVTLRAAFAESPGEEGGTETRGGEGPVGKSL